MTTPKQRIRYTGICYTISDNDPIVESYGSDKDAVLKKTLAAALCFGETRFTIVLSQYQRPVLIEHFAVTDPKTGQYRATSKAVMPYKSKTGSLYQAIITQAQEIE